MENPYAELKRKFADAFGAKGKIHVVRAPGRSI